VPTPETDFLAILHILAEARVEFIVVGGISAVLQGAPIATFDLDVVHSRTPHNIGKLLAALDRLGAYYRSAGQRERRPDESHLSSAGHQLLMTRFGPLDVLGSIGKGRDYDNLLDGSVILEVGEGLQVRVLDLPAVISTKEETGQEKDKATLAILRRTREEKAKK
jgi:hypothetical protein